MTDSRLLLSLDGDLYELKRLDGSSWRVARERAAGREYTVDCLPSGFVRCTCRGFQFRGACKHVNGLKNVGLIGSTASVGVE